MTPHSFFVDPDAADSHCGSGSSLKKLCKKLLYEKFAVVEKMPKIFKNNGAFLLLLFLNFSLFNPDPHNEYMEADPDPQPLYF